MSLNVPQMVTTRAAICQLRSVTCINTSVNGADDHMAQPDTD